jgi:hypothetical protein
VRTGLTATALDTTDTTGRDMRITDPTTIVRVTISDGKWKTRSTSGFFFFTKISMVLNMNLASTWSAAKCRFFGSS